MTFNDLPTGSAVFLDANVFVYALIAHAAFGSASTALLDHIEHQDIQGFTSADVLGEVAHRLMTIEACDRYAPA